MANKLGHCTPWGPSPLPAQAEPFKHGSDAHRSASWARLAAAAAVVEAGYDVIVSDLDAIWFRDPVRYLAEHVPPAADLVVSSDEVRAAGGASERPAACAMGEARRLRWLLPRSHAVQLAFFGLMPSAIRGACQRCHA